VHVRKALNYKALRDGIVDHMKSIYYFELEATMLVAHVKSRCCGGLLGFFLFLAFARMFLFFPESLFLIFPWVVCRAGKETKLGESGRDRGGRNKDWRRGSWRSEWDKGIG
jgi:hypothetical protein